MTVFRAENDPKSGSFSLNVRIVRIVRIRSLLFYCSQCSNCSEVIRA